MLMHTMGAMDVIIIICICILFIVIVVVASGVKIDLIQIQTLLLPRCCRSFVLTLEYKSGDRKRARSTATATTTARI